MRAQTYFGCGGGAGSETAGVSGAAGIAEFATGEGGNCQAEYPPEFVPPAGALLSTFCAKAGRAAVPIRIVAMKTDVEFMKAVLFLAFGMVIAAFPRPTITIPDRPPTRASRAAPLAVTAR
jgi:hypothetical protein